MYPVSGNLYGIADRTATILYYWQSVDFSVFLPVPTPLTRLGFSFLRSLLSTLYTLGCCYDNGGGEDYSHFFLSASGVYMPCNDGYRYHRSGIADITPGPFFRYIIPRYFQTAADVVPTSQVLLLIIILYYIYII